MSETTISSEGKVKDMMATVLVKAATGTTGRRMLARLVDGAETIGKATVAWDYGLNTGDNLVLAALTVANPHGLLVTLTPLGEVNGRTVFAVAKGGE